MPDTPFARGRLAHDRGVLRAACPYPRGSLRCREWQAGWHTALKAKFGISALVDVIEVESDESNMHPVEPDDEDYRILGDGPRFPFN